MRRVPLWPSMGRSLFTIGTRSRVICQTMNGRPMCLTDSWPAAAGPSMPGLIWFVLIGRLPRLSPGRIDLFTTPPPRILPATSGLSSPRRTGILLPLWPGRISKLCRERRMRPCRVIITFGTAFFRSAKDDMSSWLFGSALIPPGRCFFRLVMWFSARTTVMAAGQ